MVISATSINLISKESLFLNYYNVFLSLILRASSGKNVRNCKISFVKYICKWGALLLQSSITVKNDWIASVKESALFKVYTHNFVKLVITATHILVVTKGATVLFGSFRIENICCPIWFIDCIPNVCLCYKNYYQSLCTFKQIDWIAKNCVFGFYINLILLMKTIAAKSAAIAVDLLDILVKTYLRICAPDHFQVYTSEIVPVLIFKMPFLLSHWAPHSLRLSNDVKLFHILNAIELYLEKQI